MTTETGMEGCMWLDTAVGSKGSKPCARVRITESELLKRYPEKKARAHRTSHRSTRDGGIVKTKLPGAGPASGGRVCCARGLRDGEQEMDLRQCMGFGCQRVFSGGHLRLDRVMRGTTRLPVQLWARLWRARGGTYKLHRHSSQCKVSNRVPGKV